MVMNKHACVHTISNGLSQDSEGNTGKEPSLLSTDVALTWKLSQARRATDLSGTGLNMDYPRIFRGSVWLCAHVTFAALSIFL